LSIVYVLNFLSRWVLFTVTAYKAHRERSVGWAYMALAFFLAALDPERFLLEPLGFHLNNDVSYVLDMVNTFFQGIIALLAAVYIKEPEPRLRCRILPILIGILTYLWITVTNALELHLSFFVRTMVPMAVYSFSFLYLAYIILRYSLPGNIASRVFSYAMGALALLNLTYPYTVNLQWFREYGFLLGTIFRIVMAAGAVGVVLWPVERVKTPKTVGNGSGAFLISDKGGRTLIEEIGKASNFILITRGDIRRIKSLVNGSGMVFWITRAVEGEIDQSPRIYAVSPTRLGILLDLITKAIESGYMNVFVDSVEYLILENGFKTTLKFLLDLKDRVLSHNGKIVISIDPEALEKGQLNILKREFEELS
jgi:hypothetical protein